MGHQAWRVPDQVNTYDKDLFFFYEKKKKKKKKKKPMNLKADQRLVRRYKHTKIIKI